MSLRRYLLKSEVLLREADLDLHNNCFNKGFMCKQCLVVLENIDSFMFLSYK